MGWRTDQVGSIAKQRHVSFESVYWIGWVTWVAVNHLRRKRKRKMKINRKMRKSWKRRGPLMIGKMTIPEVGATWTTITSRDHKHHLGHWIREIYVWCSQLSFEIHWITNWTKCNARVTVQWTGEETCTFVFFGVCHFSFQTSVCTCVCNTFDLKRTFGGIEWTTPFYDFEVHI